MDIGSIRIILENDSHVQESLSIIADEMEVFIKTQAGNRFTARDANHIVKTVLMLNTLHNPDTIKVRIACIDENTIFERAYTFERLVILLRKEEERELDMYSDNEDADVNKATNPSYVYIHLMRTILDDPIRSLFESVKHLKKRESIKGKTCPVLLQPLTETSIKLKKCDHILSKEAWEQILAGRPDGKCPLCRVVHDRQDISTYF